jgi:hypothetical protein
VVRRLTRVLAVVSIVLPVAAAGAGTAASPAHCPSHVPANIAANQWPAAKMELAPSGATAIRLCRYIGLNHKHARSLGRSRLLTKQTLVSDLVTKFDALHAAPAGAVACPNDDGAMILAQLAYPDGHRVSIGVSLSGCQFATNGDLTRNAAFPNGRRLVVELKRLIRRA